MEAPHHDLQSLVLEWICDSAQVERLRKGEERGPSTQQGLHLCSQLGAGLGTQSHLNLGREVTALVVGRLGRHTAAARSGAFPWVVWAQQQLSIG